VNGRVAEMIRFMLDRMDTIVDTANIKIEHNCAGCRIQSKLTTFESEAKVMDSIE
jgi:hypothetical protein